jgi:quinol monooxygenase YgiN
MAIIRIVRLSFHEDKVSEFIQIFKESKPKITSCDGCIHLALMRDHNHAHVYYTFSTWASNDALEKYRQSDFFKETWLKTKALFNAKAQAFTLEEYQMAEN